MFDIGMTPKEQYEKRKKIHTGGNGSGEIGDLILEVSQDGKTVLTPISDYCAAFRAGRRVVLNNIYSVWERRYGMTMQYHTGSAGFEQKAMFAIVGPYYSSGSVDGIMCDIAEVNNNGAITFTRNKVSIT